MNNTNINELAQQLRDAAKTSLSAPEFGSSDVAGITRLRLMKPFVDLSRPKNILAILDALEAAQQYAKSRDEENQDLMLTVGRLRVEREQLEASQPVAPETLPCNVLLEPGLRFGKGIKTTTLLSALERRAEYEKEAKNETPEQKEQRLKAFFELMGLAGAQTVKRSVYDSEKWQLVPIEPTEDMIVDGFESEPYEAFSDAEEWKKYNTMSGCAQAAHRAKLCWAAMLAAAPEESK